MRRLVVVLLFVFFVCAEGGAQTKTLQVFYITKDHTTEVNPLCRNLKDIYSFAEKENSAAVIFYLANATMPKIVKMNLPGDNRKEFDAIMDALMTKSETIINVNADLKGIVSLFDEIEIRGSDGHPTFQSVELNYYITPTFWELNYNEELIAAAYFTLEMDAEWAKDYFTMSIYHNASDGLVYDMQYPFGKKNLCHNYKFFLLTYAQ